MVEIEGNPWFAAADVCKALGLPRTNAAFANVDGIYVKRAPVEGQRGRPPRNIGGKEVARVLS
ncbi:BRO family protein [Cereibacter johrii]|uniref:BRO family protein n=1 Tax=Cereibacter johrii TaxID=445629 RepID=UPI00195F7B0E